MHIIPDLKRLEKKYGDVLVIIGVHSAKFSSEKESDNIREAILRYDLEHPVVNDRDFAIWNTYGINSWPTLVLIDPTGHVVGGQAGEGGFEVFDRAIGELMKQYSAQLDRKPIKLVLEKEHRPKSVLSYPGKIAADAKGGRLFFSDSDHNRIVVASTAGEIQTVIGEGSPGLTDGDFATARFFHPQGLAYDPARDALYVADTENHAIRKVDLKAKTVTTLAGNGKQADRYPPVGGVGKSALLSTPWDVLLCGDRLYIAMAGTHQIWTLDLKTLAAEPWAGSAREDIVDGPRTAANLAQPSGLTTDGKRIFFADSEASAIREVDPTSGAVSTIVGSGLFDFGDVDGKPPTVRLQHPLGVAYNPADGAVYVADTYNHKIKRVDPAARSAVTFIGTGKRGMADGPVRSASLDEPSGLVWVGSKLYIADTNNQMIRVYDPATKTLSTLKLTNLDRLTKRTMPAFHGKEIRVAEQAVAPAATSIDITIQLPSGTKLNPDAPFKLTVTSDKPEAVTVGDVSISKPAKTLSIPITAKAGQATVTIDFGLNYCAEGNAGLCYFKDIRAVVPIRVEPAGRPTALVVVAP